MHKLTPAYIIKSSKSSNLTQTLLFIGTHMYVATASDS